MEYRIAVPPPAVSTLLMLISYATVSAVLFAPAIPEMRDFFGVSNAAMQLPVIAFLLFYALAQPVFGPLANSIGRKKTIYSGLVLGVLGSAVCAISGNFHSFLLLVVGRCVAAFGCGAGLVMAFTIINDFYFPAQALKVTAWAAIAFAAAPGLSATVGGFLVTYGGWQSCFWLLALYGIIILLLCARLPETCLAVESINTREIVTKYALVLSGKNLICFSAVLGATTAILYVFAALGPLIVVNFLKVRADIYGMLNLILTSGLLLGNIIVINARQVVPARMVACGLIIITAGAVVFALLFSQGVIDLCAVFIPGFVMFLGIALLYSSAATLATARAEDKASASAVMSFINVGLGCFGTVIASLLPFEPEVNMPVALIIIVVIMATAFLAGKKYISDF